MSRKKRSFIKTDPLFDVENVASCTECTGIAPIGLEDDWQQNQLASLLSIHKRHLKDEEDVFSDEDWPR